MKEIVLHLKIRRETGYRYFLNRRTVYRVPLRQRNPPRASWEAVASVSVALSAGYFYFLDADGNIARVRRRQRRSMAVLGVAVRRGAVVEDDFVEDEEWAPPPMQSPQAAAVQALLSRLSGCTLSQLHLHLRTPPGRSASERRLALGRMLDQDPTPALERLATRELVRLLRRGFCHEGRAYQIPELEARPRAVLLRLCAALFGHLHLLPEVIAAYAVPLSPGESGGALTHPPP